MGIRPKADEAQPIKEHVPRLPTSTLRSQCLLAIAHCAKSTFQEAYQLANSAAFTVAPIFTWTLTQGNKFHILSLLLPNP